MITDAQIGAQMGWKGPGAYSAAAMRKVRALVDASAAAEREACAKSVEALQHGNVTTCAAAIRARGEA